MVQILKKSEVASLTSYSERHLDRLIKDNRFPAPIELNEGGSRIGFYQSEVLEWIESRPRRGNK